jgi:hypothetical protein
VWAGPARGGEGKGGRKGQGGVCGLEQVCRRSRGCGQGPSQQVVLKGWLVADRMCVEVCCVGIVCDLLAHACAHLVAGASPQQQLLLLLALMLTYPHKTPSPATSCPNRRCHPAAVLSSQRPGAGRQAAAGSRGRVGQPR